MYIAIQWAQQMKSRMAQKFGLSFDWNSLQFSGQADSNFQLDHFSVSLSNEQTIFDFVNQNLICGNLTLLKPTHTHTFLTPAAITCILHCNFHQ